MYVCNESDRTLLQERVHQFRGQVDRFLSGDLPEEEFKQLRLRNGLYMELHAPMLRVGHPLWAALERSGTDARPCGSQL